MRRGLLCSGGWVAPGLHAAPGILALGGGVSGRGLSQRAPPPPPRCRVGIGGGVGGMWVTK